MIEKIKRWYLFLNRHTVVVVWFLYLAPVISVVVGALTDSGWVTDITCLLMAAVAITYMVGNGKGWNRGVER